MNNKTNKIKLIIDKYTNLFYICLTNNKLVLLLNKCIFKFDNIFYKILHLKNKYNELGKLFNKIFSTFSKYLNVKKSINIIINRIYYQSILCKNKLIVKISNFKNIIIYIPNIKDVNINISYENNLINLSSNNINYITNLALLIKNIKKIDRCTGIGMHYSDEKIVFKRKIINDIKKKFK